MNLQSFKASPREITFVRLLKSSMSYFPLVLCKFLLLTIYDRFIRRQPCACMHACMHLLNFSVKKNFSETIDWTFTKFHSSVS